MHFTKNTPHYRYEVMMQSVPSIRRLRNRLERFIRESEVNPMPYFNKHHEREFNEALNRIDTENAAQLSAVYLMSADALLWHKAKPFVGASGIDFAKIPIGSIGEKASTLFACAKDLCKGTKHITLADICDEQIISPKLFGVICTAMAVRRFGIESLNCIKGDVQNDTRRTDK